MPPRKIPILKFTMKPGEEPIFTDISGNALPDGATDGSEDEDIKTQIAKKLEKMGKEAIDAHVKRHTEAPAPPSDVVVVHGDGRKEKRPKKSGRSERSERSERKEKEKEKEGRSERKEKEGRSEKGHESKKAGRSEKGHKSERKEKRSEKAGRSEKDHRSERKKKRSEKGRKSEKGGRSEKDQRPERKEHVGGSQTDDNSFHLEEEAWNGIVLKATKRPRKKGWKPENLRNRECDAEEAKLCHGKSCDRCGRQKKLIIGCICCQKRYCSVKCGKKSLSMQEGFQCVTCREE